MKKNLFGLLACVLFLTSCMDSVHEAIKEPASRLSQMNLNLLVRDIEFYKVNHGQYPDNLEQLSDDLDFSMTSDPIYSFSKNQDSTYQYQRIGDKYLLLSVGLDDMANTDDDLYPQIKLDSNSKVGFIQRDRK